MRKDTCEIVELEEAVAAGDDALVDALPGDKILFECAAFCEGLASGLFGERGGEVRDGAGVDVLVKVALEDVGPSAVDGGPVEGKLECLGLVEDVVGPGSGLGVTEEGVEVLGML